MKTGKTLNELAQEITRQSEQKKDFLADSSQLAMSVNTDIKLEGHGFFMPTDHFHQQLASRLKIPMAYYDRMKIEQPELLAINVNTWFKANPEERLIRTLDGKARAFLSERYRTLDNFDLLSAVLPIIQEQNCKLASCEVTEQRFYLKVLFDKVEAELKKDDIVQAGLVISNSEVGSGSLRIEPLIYRLVCTNGMIMNTSMRKYHVGRGIAGDDESAIRELLSNSTKELSDRAFWAQVCDIVRSSFNTDIFNGNVAKLISATENKITKDPSKVIELIRKDHSLNENVGVDIMKHLIEGGDLSQFGLAQAVTRTANDQNDYELATTLERTGGKIIELSKHDWSELAAA